MSDTKLIAQLVANGIASTDHHAKVKKAIEEATDQKPSKEDYQRIKGLLEQVEQEPKAEVVTLEERQALEPDKWGKVVRIVEASPEGKPYRVVIACQDVQDEEICEGEREIATQDLFQVERCVPCQRRAMNRRRAQKRKAKAQAKPKAKV